MKTITSILFLIFLSLNLEAETLKDFITKEKTNILIMVEDKNNTLEMNPFYQGEIVHLEQAGAYTYMEVKERTNKTFWIATNSVDAKKGDYIRFQKELVVKKFKSKILDKVFTELMFASNLEYRIKK